MIYFFATDFDRVKIGHCKGNLYNRKRQIQNGCPDPIQLLGVILCEDETDMRRRETELHIQFQEHNTVGEWFRLVTDISDFIEDFAEVGQSILQEDHQSNLGRCRKHREQNHEKNLERKRKYREQNREKIRARDSEYRKRQVNKRRCRAKKRVANQQITLNFD